MSIAPREALERLEEGNRQYMQACVNKGDISPAIREKTAREGQFPYAIILACSDSRVIPEHIFSAGIGELFVIRVAGNVIDNHQLGSIEYAASHLGTRLVVILGHTHCGAVGAAIHHEKGGYIGTIVEEIEKAIGEETDDEKAAILNACHNANLVRKAFEQDFQSAGVEVVPAVYEVDSGNVRFLAK